MTNFLFVFRLPTSEVAAPTPEVMNERMLKWNAWMGWMAQQVQITGGNHLNPKGKVLRKHKIVTDGPFVETKEMLAGYIIVSAETEEQALRLAAECPILEGDGSVEVRALAGRG